MIILSQTTDALEVKMGALKTTNEAQCTASWRDITTTAFAPDRTVTNTNGTTVVNAVPSPAGSTQRVVDLINIYNADTVTQTITVQFNANGTRYVLISAALATGESLVYQEGAGWSHLNAAGAPIVSTGITAINGTAAEITATAAGSVVTLSLPTALTFTGKTVTGGTFSSPTLVTPALGTPASGNLVNCTGYVGTSALVTVGALTSGSIGSGFGSINVGANSITGGATSVTTLNASGFFYANGSLAVRGSTFPSSGKGMELVTESSTITAIQSYDRDGSLWMDAKWYAKSHNWLLSGTSKMLLDTTGLAVTGSLSTTTGITSTVSVNGAVALYGKFVGGGYGASLQSTDDTSGAAFAIFTKGDNTAIGSIGRVTTTNAVAFNTTSDGRLKTNIRDFTAADAGRIIDGLSPRWFDWKQDPNDQFVTGMTADTVDADDKTIPGKPIKTKRKDLPQSMQAQLIADATAQVGFVAQEEHAVDPLLARIGAVTPGDSDPAVITRQWQRSDAALVPILVAAIKDLRARVAALEPKKP